MAAGETSLQQAVHSLYSDHHGWLLGWLRKKLSCAHSAADIAQDTFLRILLSRDVLVGMREPRAYLTTTAKRLILDRARRRRIEEAYLSELAILAETASVGFAPEQVLEALQALEQIGKVLEGVTPKAREAFLLHYLEDLPQDAVALELGVSDRMVRKYLAQVLLQCRSIVD
jgi:RNA polymerase sigma factor (sigma-70 family)